MFETRTLFRFLPLAAALALAPLGALAQTTPAPAPIGCRAPTTPQVLWACRQGTPLGSDGSALIVAPAADAIEVVRNVPWAEAHVASDIIVDPKTAVVTAFDPVLHQARLTVTVDSTVLHVVTLKPASGITGEPLAFAVLTAGGLAGSVPPGGAPGVVLQLPGGNQLYARQFDPVAGTVSFEKPPSGNDKFWVTGTLGRTTLLRAHVVVDPAQNAEPITLAVAMTQGGVTVGGDAAKLDVALGPFSVTLAGIAATISQASAFNAKLTVKTPSSFPFQLDQLPVKFEAGGIALSFCQLNNLLQSERPVFASKDLGVGLTITNAAFHCTPGSAPTLDGLSLGLNIATPNATSSYKALVTDTGVAFTDSNNVTTPNALALPITGTVNLVGLKATVSSVLLSLPTLGSASSDFTVTVNASAKLPGLDTIAIPPGSYAFALGTPTAGGARSLRPLCPRDAADESKVLSVAIPAGSPVPFVTVGPLKVSAHCTNFGKPATETWAGIDGDGLPIAFATSQLTTSAPITLPSFTIDSDGLRWGAAGMPATACLDLYAILRPTGYDGKSVKPQPCTIPATSVAASAVLPSSSSDDTEPLPIPSGTVPNLSIFGFKAYVLDGTSAYYGCLPNKNGAGCHSALAIALNALGTFDKVTGDTNNGFSAVERGLVIDTSDPTNLLGAYSIKPYHFSVAGLHLEFVGQAGDELGCDGVLKAGIRFDPGGDGIKACGRIVFPGFLKHERPNLDPDLPVNASAVGVQMDEYPTSLYVKKLWIHGQAGSHAIDSDIELDEALKCDLTGPSPRPSSTNSFGIFQFCMPPKGFQLQSNGGAVSVHLQGYLRVTKGLPTDNIAKLDAAFNKNRFVAYATLTDFTAHFGPNTVSVANIKIVSGPTYRSVAGDVVVQSAQFGNAEIYLRNVGIEQRRDDKPDAQWRAPKVIGKPDLAKTGTSFGLKIIGDFFTVFAFHGFKFKGL